MKLAGMLLLLAGWGIVLFAVALLSLAALCSIFVAAGMGIEVLGLALAFRKEAL